MIQATIICQKCRQSNPSGATQCVSCGEPLPKPVEIFLSYAHEDEALKKKLVTHLSILQRTRGTFLWHDRDIKAGDDWATAIDDHLKTADIILLLISAYFLASNYCYSIEMEAAMERHKLGQAKVVPIILRPVELEDTPFMRLQALPQGAKAVSTWQNQDEAWLNVVQEIKRIL